MKITLSIFAKPAALAFVFWVTLSAIAQENDKDIPTEEAGESSAAALIVYNDAANYQNNGALEVAVDEWKKFLNRFGQDPKAVDAKYNLGACYLQLKNFSAAVATLKELVDAEENFEKREDALLNLGWAHYSLGLQSQQEEFVKAIAAFARLLKDYPKSKFGDQAYFFQGEAFYVQGKRQEAALSYQKLVTEFKDSKMRPDGLYALGVCYEELARFDEAGKVFDEFLANFKDHHLASEIAMRKAETVLRAGNFADAEKRFEKIVSIQGFAMADHALYRQAFCVAEQQRFQEAGDLFARLLDQFPKSRYAEQASMAAGRAYFRTQQLDQASGWFTKVVSNQGSHAVEAAHWQARILIDAKRHDAALALIDKVLGFEGADRNSFFANLQLDRADALYEMEDRRAEAYESYMQLAKEYVDQPLGPQALYNAAFAAMELKHDQEALAHAKQFLKQYNDHPLIHDVKHVAAESHLRLGNNDAAAKLFADVTSSPQGAKNKSALIRQALALYLEGKYQAAMDLLENRWDQFESPEDTAEANYVLGISQFGMRQWQASEASLKRALKASSHFAQADEAMLQLSRVLRKQKKIKDAIAIAKRAIKKYPESKINDQIRFRLAEYHYADENYDEAIQAYTGVLSSKPKTTIVPFSLYGLGWSQLRSHRLTDAVNSFSKLIANHADHKLADQSRYARAMARQQLGEFQQALADTANYLTTNRTSRQKSDALYLRGLCEVGLKQPEKAKATFQSVLDDSPEYPEADKVIYEIAWVYKNQQDEDQAAKYFQMLSEKHPNSDLACEANFHVGENLYRQANYEQSINYYLSAISSPGMNTKLGERILYKTGWAYYQSDAYEQAIESFAAQVSRFPDSKLRYDALFMQAKALFKLEKFADALTFFQQIKGVDTLSEQIQVLTLLHGGQSFGQLKRWDESISWLEQVDSRFPKSAHHATALYELGWAHQNKKDLDSALRYYNRVTEKSRGEVGARARFMMGEIFYANRKYGQAIKEFQKVMYGYGAEKAPEAIKQWQAKAGFEAGQCSGVLASQEQNRVQRKRYIDDAKKFFTFVTKLHSGTKEAEAASQQLQKY